eukprot:CAMPEP_0171105620 /NCGR_PEP_ID=MMETSP0766_2-20121228/63091_1 /TAXON_ID=439317 /ORGANISM="Gambierdiscus australes, Strain CAWD 149" /LENGTH=78 /DNA_ID=CAMNT_0011566527 /DNA_START=405 /DNA_END=641 /DNA_ORIENTATION=-
MPSERSTSTPSRGPPAVFFKVIVNSFFLEVVAAVVAGTGVTLAFTGSSSVGEPLGREPVSSMPSFFSSPAQHFAPIVA